MAKSKIETVIKTKRYNLYFPAFIINACLSIVSFLAGLSNDSEEARIILIIISVLVIIAATILLGVETGADYKVKQVYVDGIKIKEEEVQE